MIAGAKIKAALIFLAATVSMTASSYADDRQAGRFVQLRGSATIERGKSRLSAKLKDGIIASDAIFTGDASRAKLLFIDDSVLTMSENSKLVVQEFIYSKGDQGKSVFNLLDGKMRSVVGKTRFEVHTPTAVAAARGTVIYFDVGMVNNQSYSKIICLEGTVQIRNIVSTVTGQVTLTPGTMVVVKANEPPPPPVPTPPTELEKAKKAIQGNGGDPGGDTPPASNPPTDPITPQTPVTPPIQQQPIFQPRKVNIIIGIP